MITPLCQVVMDGRRTKLRPGGTAKPFSTFTVQDKHTDVYSFISCAWNVMLCLASLVGWLVLCLFGGLVGYIVGLLWVRMTPYSSFFMTFGIHSVFRLIGDVDSEKK